MPTATATIDIPLHDEPVLGTAPGQSGFEGSAAGEQDYQPRFRVVARKPLPRAVRPPASPVNRAFFLAFVPAVMLVAYVLCWTLVIRGGYVKDGLERRIQEAKIEHSELLARKHALQAPGQILWSARQMGLAPGPIERARVPKSALPSE